MPVSQSWTSQKKNGFPELFPFLHILLSSYFFFGGEGGIGIPNPSAPQMTSHIINHINYLLRKQNTSKYGNIILIDKLSQASSDIELKN